MPYTLSEEKILKDLQKIYKQAMKEKKLSLAVQIKTFQIKWLEKGDKGRNRIKRLSEMDAKELREFYYTLLQQDLTQPDDSPTSKSR